MLINLSLLHLAMTSYSSVVSPSLLRLAEAMYPAALKTLSTFAEVAGIQWCLKCKFAMFNNKQFTKKIVIEEMQILPLKNQHTLRLSLTGTGNTVKLRARRG